MFAVSKDVMLKNTDDHHVDRKPGHIFGHVTIVTISGPKDFDHVTIVTISGPKVRAQNGRVCGKWIENLARF